jgi:hypothetical protein
MELTAALALLTKQIAEQIYHCDYDRTVKQANTGFAFATGKGLDGYLRRFNRRETPEMFQQRLELGIQYIDSIWSTLEQPLYDAANSDRIRFRVNVGDARQQQNVETMMREFYGSPNRDSRGLAAFMSSRFVDISTYDPNAWIVVEWDQEPTLTTPIKPRPFIVYADMAMNFKVVNGVTKWLFVKDVCDVYGYQDPTFPMIQGHVTPPRDPKALLCKEGTKYTLYDEDYTITAKQIDKDYRPEDMPERAETIEIAGLTYWLTVNKMNLGYPPAFRMGYKADRYTKGRTFVSPLKNAFPFFKKLLKNVSEFDLTVSLHVFPQKISLVQPCGGEGPEPGDKCHAGFIRKGRERRVCQKCGGTGHMVVSTAQEAVYIPMPSDISQVPNLENMVAYKSPPIELIKFMNELSLQLEKQAHHAVYNSTALIKINFSAGGVGQEQPEVTATADTAQYENIYKAVRPFSLHYSSVCENIATVMAREAMVPPERIEVSHRIPRDLKLKNTRDLTNELKTANESGAPSFLVDGINNDLAEIQFSGDPLGKRKYDTQRRFFPFGGKSKDEIAQLMSSSDVPRESKVLYANYEPIFTEIEEGTPEFYILTPTRQRQLVDDMVAEWMERIAAQAPAPVFNIAPTDSSTGEDTPPDEEAEE